MNNFESYPYRELEERTFKFAQDSRDYAMKLPRNISNFEYSKQLIRSSGSQAANYIEANEGLSSKDRCYRFKICRKETKESRMWLRLSITNENPGLIDKRNKLIREADELRRIFSRLIQLHS